VEPLRKARPILGRVKCNVTVRTITSANGWFAQYGRKFQPLLCWALTDDGIVGLILGPGGDARNAEDELVDGSKFTSYQYAGPAPLHVSL
jgi:hypothetical protein